MSDMGQISPHLRSVQGGIAHWCPACEEMHVVYTSKGWSFDGNLEAPTVTPSLSITYNGPDAGTIRESGQRAPFACCHYNITAGSLIYQADSTHPFANRTVPLPELPAEYRDPDA